jgi:hypothetical protein
MRNRWQPTSLRRRRNHRIGRLWCTFLGCFLVLLTNSACEAEQDSNDLADKHLIIVPRAADRPDRTGKWKQADEETALDKKTTVATVYEPIITTALELAIKDYWTEGNGGRWIVATSYEASQILNDFGKASELVANSGDYKIILLNPNENLIEMEKLEAITDPNLIVVEINKEYPAPYSSFLARFQPKHNLEIVDWVRGKNMFQSDKDWVFLTEGELFKIGRVATGILGPKSLPQHKNNAFGPNDLTVEKILEELDKIAKDGPHKEVSNRASMMIRYPRCAPRFQYFTGWKDEEIIAYLDHTAKWAANIANPFITYVSWGDNLKEVMNAPTPPPEEFSNREKWEAKGFRVLDQHGMKGGSCHSYANAHAIQAAMIEAGEDGGQINEIAWQRMAEADYKNKTGAGRRQWAFGSGHGRARVMWDFGYEDIMIKGIPLKSGKRFKPLQMVVRDIKNFHDYPGTYTPWLKHRVSPEITMPRWGTPLHWKLVREGKFHTHKYELLTGYRDAMIKKEISNGRPVILDAQLPELWNEDGFAFKERGNIVQRPWVKIPRGRKSRWDGLTHVIIIVGYKTDKLDSRRTIYECLNSWGPGWGDGGYFWLGSEWLDWLNFNHRPWMASISFK